jgi:uncharacterized protein YciI
MLFVVLLTDQPDHAQVRADHLQAHIDWLERHKDVIQVGGSLRREPSETPKGGLWIAQADSKQIIDALLQTDPFYLAGLRQSYEILYWSKANSARQVLI